MEIANPMLEGFSQTGVTDMVQMRLQILQFDIQESIRLVICTTVSKKIVDGQTTLPPRWDENDDGLRRGVFDDSKVRRF